MIPSELLQQIAQRIDTGAGDPAVARPLIVFNVAETEFTGTAVFAVDMSWRNGLPFPNVSVWDIAHQPVPSCLGSWVEGRDPQKRPDYHRISFNLCFAVTGVPPRGWTTYFARYSQESPTETLSTSAFSNSECFVVETLFHPGNLPLTGQFGDDPSWGCVE